MARSRHFLSERGHIVLWGGAIALGLALWNSQRPGADPNGQTAGTGAYSNVAANGATTYGQRPAQSPPVLGGAGNTPFGARDDPYGIYQSIPAAAINGLLPAVTQDAFAAFPRSAALQGG